MQINRLFEIIYLLMDRRSMTTRELANYFEVSTRTIMRDIDILSQAKIPIYTSRGKGGGISLLDGFVLNKTALSEDEQKQILLSLKSLSSTGNPGSTQVLRKVEALFAKANTDTDWIEVDFSRWGQGTQDNMRFTLLKESILSEKAVSFTYINSEGKSSTRTLFPLKLVFKSQAWYLQGFDEAKKDYRTFRINRILELTETDKNFDRALYHPPSLESPGNSSLSSIVFEAVFSAPVSYRAYDYFDEGSIDRMEDGSVHLRVRIPENDWLYGIIRSLGDTIEIIQPEHLRNK